MTFSEAVRLGMIPRTAVTLTRPDQTSADVLGVIAISDTVLRVLFEPQLLEGQYTFKLAPTPAITDRPTTSKIKNSNGIAGELPQDTFTSTLILQRRPLRIVSQIPASAPTTRLLKSMSPLAIPFKRDRSRQPMSAWLGRSAMLASMP